MGAVKETVPSPGGVWIREALDGHRRVVDAQDTELRHHLPGTDSVPLPARDQR